MVYLGIDPGKSGGIALISDTGKVSVFATPTTKDNELDIEAIYQLLYETQYVCIQQNQQLYCVLEDVHSIFGMSAKSNFQFGRGLGILEGILGSLKIEFVKITPKVWQKEVWGNIEPIATDTGKLLKNGQPKLKIDTKATSLMVAKTLFPDVNLLATSRSKVEHDGIVDALLIAEYCRRKFKK